VKSSQGLPSINKNTLVLEKENTQAKSPSSIDQFMQPSQTTEIGMKIYESMHYQSIKLNFITTVLLNYTIIGSSNPSKVKRVRGSNKCKEVASLEAGKRLKVTFYNNRTVGTNSNLFSRHLGKVIRDCNMCPLGVSSWSDIKQQKLYHMWAAITVPIFNYIIIVFIFWFFVLSVNYYLNLIN